MQDSKKAERKKRIQNSALELFSQSGFAQTSISRIAENAGMGTGTLYNYFKSKGDILLSIIENRSCGYVEELDKILKNETGELFTSLSLFQDCYLTSFSLYNKRIWREFMANLFSGDSDLLKGIYEIDRPYMEALAALLVKFQKAGVLRKNADIENMVLTIYDASMYAILSYIAEDGMPLADLKTRLAKHTRIIVSASSPP